MKISPFAICPPPMRNGRAVGGVLDELTGDLPGGDLTSVLTNRYLYNLRWNARLQQWVEPQYEFADALPFSATSPATAASGSANWPLWLGLGVGGLVLVLLLARK